MAPSTSQVHVLMMTWSGYGHMVPLLQLAELLCSADFLITIAYSSRTHARLLQASSPVPQNPKIRVEIIPDGLPSDLSYTPSTQEIRASTPVMQNGLDQLVGRLMEEDNPVTCMISGTFVSWTRVVAQKFCIPRIELWSSMAIVYSIGFHYDRFVSEGIVPFKGRREETWITCIPGVPPMRASDYPSSMIVESGVNEIRERCKDVYGGAKDSERVLINSIYELEGSAFDALQADEVCAYAVGPLFLQSLNNTFTENLPETVQTSMYTEDLTCLQWLDGKATASILFIAFGSESHLPKSDIQELALGLEASQQHFLWVIRPGSVIEESSLSEILPDGFQERTQQRGLVISWAPQKSVLGHPAVGGFLSHCGWNSIMEALWLGVPIIAWPQRADQGLNKWMIEEEWKVGIAIKKEEGGAVGRLAIEKAVRDLMQSEEGLQAKKRVLEVREVIINATKEGGSSRTNLQTFINDLRLLSSKGD